MDNQLSTGALAVIAAAGGVGALLAGLVAAFVGWQTESRRAVREHQTWLRERKFDAYAEFISSSRLLVAYLSAENVSTPPDLIGTFDRRFFECIMLIDGERLGDFERERARLGSESANQEDGREGRRENREALANITTLLRADLLSTVPTSKRA